MRGPQHPRAHQAGSGGPSGVHGHNPHSAPSRYSRPLRTPNRRLIDLDLDPVPDPEWVPTFTQLFHASGGDVPPTDWLREGLASGAFDGFPALQALARDVTIDPQSLHAPTALRVPHGMPHAPLQTENQVSPISTTKYIPWYTPPGHIPPDLPAVLAVWVFTHYTLGGEWPYRPHS